MNPPLADDTDEENCDDPIKLFDNNLNAIYFGSNPLVHRDIRDTENHWRLETIGNSEFCQPRQNSTLVKPDAEPLQQRQSGTIRECDITPLCIKLVDCGKFPWYFRKYTQQIVDKINSNQHSDSEHDISVEVIEDDSDDCYIVEDTENVTNAFFLTDQLRIKVKSIEDKIKRNRKKSYLEMMKRRKDNEEIKKALRIKHLVQVDLKRNQGLVGMKIVQKIETNKTPDTKGDGQNVVEKVEVKQECTMADEKYVNAADKTLGQVGTQLIPIIEKKESNSICQITVTNEKTDLVPKTTLVQSSSSQNVTVQFDITKISDKLIDNLMTKKVNDQFSEAKIISQSNESLLKKSENKTNIVIEKELKSMKVTHVKDMKKSNKYKNDQNKINVTPSSHSSLIGILVTNKSKEDIKDLESKKHNIHSVGTQKANTQVVKKPRKKIEKQESIIKSPILPCGTVPKKPTTEMPPECNIPDANSNLSKELGRLSKIVDQLTNSKSCSLMPDTNRPKPIVFPRKTQNSFNIKQVSRIESRVKPTKTECPDKLFNNFNEVKSNDFKTNYFRHTKMISSIQNNTLSEQNVLPEPQQNNVNRQRTNTVADTHSPPKVPVKNNKPSVCNSNVVATTVVMPASGSNSINFIPCSNLPKSHGPHFPIHNAVPSKMSTNNIPNKYGNVPVQNRNASTNIFKSNNNQINFPCEKYCEPSASVQTLAPQIPMTILSHSQPQCRDPQPPYPIFYPPVPTIRHPEYYSDSVNSVPNQFLPLQRQQPCNPMQDFYRECWLPQNLAAPPPPPPPIPPPDIPPRNGHEVNQSKGYCNLVRSAASVIRNPQIASLQTIVNNLQGENSSIIGKNNNGLVKKINIVAMPVQKNVNKGTIKVEQIKNPQIVSPVKNTEVAATKKEMLKELDKLSFVNGNSLKEIHPASIIDENKNNNAFEVAIMSKKPGRFETLTLTMKSKDSPRQAPVKGYSPPILPIPSYQKVLDQVALNPLSQKPKITPRPGDPRSEINSKSETKPMRKRDFIKGIKRKLNNAWTNNEESKKKEDAKKISLEEYKKRVNKDDCKTDDSKNFLKEKFKKRKHGDSTETDLGYDSDSTVIL